MHITLYAYRAKPGQTDAVLSLYRQWQQLSRDWNGVSAELLSNIQDPDEMIILARFPDEEAAWAAVESAHHRAWYAQLARVTETGPIVSHYERQ